MHNEAEFTRLVTAIRGTAAECDVSVLELSNDEIHSTFDDVTSKVFEISDAEMELVAYARSKETAALIAAMLAFFIDEGEFMQHPDPPSAPAG